MENNQLIKLAIEARERAYAPYSHWKVGAALLCKDGTVFKGCNIENNSFSPTICAERTAIFKAVSEGEKEFEKIAVVGGNEKEGITGFCTPCGVCRQVMTEFCNPDEFKVIVAKNEKEFVEYSLRQLIFDANFIKDDSYGFKG